MSNRRMKLSVKGKELLDLIMENLEVERPLAIKIALAKGLQNSNKEVPQSFLDGKQGWVIPDNIIKDNEFLLFKHLIFEELNQSTDDESLHDIMSNYIEKGLRDIYEVYQQKTSMEDLKIAIL
ncbi:hypothetical protein [Alkalibacillus aidingensis]|uniref:hypothetical protein n=1 Tax=Alkalibacillus aidingensis TaxID=2747607 RepID=UPI00166023D2|nr:hypothetical protein [Alkalibacillus aidingensis]